MPNKYCNTCKYFTLEKDIHKLLYDFMIGEGFATCCAPCPESTALICEVDGRKINFGGKCHHHYYNLACPMYKESIHSLFNVTTEEIESVPPYLHNIHTYLRYIAKGGGPWEGTLEKGICK